MTTINIYSNRTATLEASEYISNNIATAYIGMKGNNTYYNVNGIVWEVWQSGCGNYPTSNGALVSNFILN